MTPKSADEPGPTANDITAVALGWSGWQPEGSKRELAFWFESEVAAREPMTLVGAVGSKAATLPIPSVTKQEGEVGEEWTISIVPPDGIGEEEPVLALVPAVARAKTLAPETFFEHAPEHFKKGPCGKHSPNEVRLVAADLDDDGKPDAVGYECDGLTHEDEDLVYAATSVRRSSGQWDVLSKSWAD